MYHSGATGKDTKEDNGDLQKGMLFLIQIHGTALLASRLTEVQFINIGGKEQEFCINERLCI